MFLYHISDHPFTHLKPYRLQTMSKSELDKMDNDYEEYGTPAYTWSLSFFFDPPPYDQFFLHYGPNDRWVPGSVVYQHTVKTSSLTDIMYWKIVESPINTLLIKVWDIMEPDDWFQYRWKLLAATNHMGFDINTLENKMEKYVGSTRQYFQKLWDDPSFADVKDHYAPNVPHLMLWSKKPIPVSEVTRVQIPN